MSGLPPRYNVALPDPTSRQYAFRDRTRVLDHSAFRRGTSAATIETVPSTTTVITAARTTTPARRVHRAIRVRATSAPAKIRASSDARRWKTNAAPTRCSHRTVIRTASRRARIRYHGSRRLRRLQKSSDSTPSSRAGGASNRPKSCSSADPQRLIMPRFSRAPMRRNLRQGLAYVIGTPTPTG